MVPTAILSINYRVPATIYTKHIIFLFLFFKILLYLCTREYSII
jgi:hypothetical protein